MEFFEMRRFLFETVTSNAKWFTAHSSHMSYLAPALRFHLCYWPSLGSSHCAAACTVPPGATSPHPTYTNHYIVATVSM